MTRLLAYLVLPRGLSTFERSYLQRVNRIALGFFWLHPPAFAVIALIAGTPIGLAVVLSLAAMVGPTLAYVTLGNRPRLISMVYGFTAMLMGGVLVYIGQGPMQIEMHFYFFVLIALLAVFGDPLVIVIAAVTVVLHHLVVWLTIPAGVFNYDASLWAVAVHAIFVVIESVAACFVARSFFDNVIGLERIVTARTSDLDTRNRDMALILDNVAQGFVTIKLDGSIGNERSRALTRWFGEPAPGAKWWDYVADNPDVAAWMQLGFDGIVDGYMPLDVVIDQLPARHVRGDRQLRVEYRPLGAPPTALLVVVSDVTDELARARAEAAQRELIAVVEKANRDRAGFVAFASDADELIARCTEASDEPLAELKRRLHTLKGNAALFGATTIAELSHDLETVVDAEDAPLSPAHRASLTAAWRAFRDRVDPVLGLTSRRTIMIDWDEYQDVVGALAPPEPAWAASLRRWGQDPTRAHLDRFAVQARGLAARLGKLEPDIEIDDGDVRVDPDRFMPLWTSLVHVVRNAVDHGIEASDRRRAAGKPERGRLVLRTMVTGGELVVDVLDDGGGIDWDRIAVRARELGLPAGTPRELEEALFASGLSTAVQVTDVSGRGVGLDAVRTICRALGGAVELTSQLGHGTRFRCTVPVVAPLGASARAHSASIPSHVQ